MTKTVTIAATRTNGDPYAHHDVIVTLVAGSAGGVVGSNVIVSQTKVPLNASGQGSIVLATNDVEITSPSTSFYRFTVEGSSPTITRSVRITDALPSTISWTRSGIEVGDPTIPQRDVASEYVTVDGDIGILDPDTMRAAIIEACIQNGVEEATAEYIADAYEALGIIDPASLHDVVVNTAHLLAHIGGGAALVGVNLAAVAATVADLLNVTETPPAEPSTPEEAVWFRPVGDLRNFVDFRLFPDGLIDQLKTNGTGGSDPAVLRSFTAVHPLYGGVPAEVTGGAVRSSGIAVDGEDNTPRTGFTFEGVAPGATGRAEWGHGGYTQTDGTFTTYSPTNLGISAPVPEGEIGPHAYLMGVVVGRFDPGLDTTDPGNPVSARMRLVRDDYAAPTTIASAALPRVPVKGDRFAFSWDGDGNLAGHMNGVEIVTATDTIHDISTFVAVGMVMHQGSVGDYTWEDAYYCGVEWFGISDGDQITGDLGPHRWTEQAGWVPIGPGARPASSFGGGSGAVDSVNGETGTVVLSAADVGVLRPEGPAFHTASSNAAMTALSAVRGDVCFRSDLDSTLYVLTSNTPTNLGDWTVLRFNSSTPVFPSEFTAKGDLLVATGAGAFAAVPRGADGTVLKAKTSETPGVEWGDAVDTATLAKIGTTVEAASDTAARTSTTAAADGVLEFTAAANTSYRIDAYLIFQGDATADLKIGFTIPAGTLHLTVEGALTTVASGSDYDRFLTLTSSGQTAAAGIAGASTPISVRVTGVIRPTSAGTVALVWAPNATGAGTGVTRLARSQLYYRAV